MQKKSLLFIDFEMCMVKGKARTAFRGMSSEIIQIGAVMLDGENQIVDEFVSFVRPEYGTLDQFIYGLTGISEKHIEDAPKLRGVLNSFAIWLNKRKVIAVSWSDSDYYQLKNEMRIKKISNHFMDDLFEEWSDMQRTFDKMLGHRESTALEKALVLAHVQSVGREHDGLVDAYNAANLYRRISGQSMFTCTLVPIASYREKVRPLSYRMGELFTSELLSQIQFSEETMEEESVLEVDNKNAVKKSLRRKLFEWIHRKENITDEKWNCHLFEKEMKRLDREERRARR